MSPIKQLIDVAIEIALIENWLSKLKEMYKATLDRTAVIAHNEIAIFLFWDIKGIFNIYANIINYY